MIRLLLAFLAGIAFSISMGLVGNRLVLATAIEPSNAMFWFKVNGVTHLAIYIVVLGALLWPMRSWWRTIWVTLAGSVGNASATLVGQIATGAPGADLGQSVVQLSVLWILTGIPLCLAARLRAHWNPAHRPGHCRQCGYNLTGNVSGACPECGTEVEER